MSYSPATFTIPSGATQSNIFTLPPDAILASLLVPEAITGDKLTFLGDLGNGEMTLLNFSFDLTSTTPYFKGQIVPSLQTKFLGLKRLQLKTDLAQTANVTIVGGYIF